MLTLTLFLLSASPARAMHAYPIQPVKVSLRVEPDRLVADIDSESTIWIEEVLGLNPLPPSAWPAQVQAKAEEYINSHFRLQADGARLPGHLADAAFVQRPWQVNEQGRVLLRMTYPPVRHGAELSVEADFFEDYRQELLESLQGRPLPFAEEYKTLLRAGRRTFTLKPGLMTCLLPEAAARPSAARRARIAFGIGFRTLFDSASAWPALAALALALAAVPPTRRRGIVWLLAPLVGLAAASLHPTAPDAAAWTAGLLAAAAAGDWLGPLATESLAAGALALLGWAWGTWAQPWLPAAAASTAVQAAAALGTLAAAAAVLGAGWAAARFERKRLESVSQTRAEQLFVRRRRLAATTLIVVCVYGLSQNLHLVRP